MIFCKKEMEKYLDGFTCICFGFNGRKKIGGPLKILNC